MNIKSCHSVVKYTDFTLRPGGDSSIEWVVRARVLSRILLGDGTAQAAGRVAPDVGMKVTQSVGEEQSGQSARTTSSTIQKSVSQHE